MHHLYKTTQPLLKEAAAVASTSPPVTHPAMVYLTSTKGPNFQPPLFLQTLSSSSHTLTERDITTIIHTLGKSPHARSILLHPELRTLLRSMAPTMTTGKSLSLCLAALSTVKAQPDDGLLEVIERRVGQLASSQVVILSEQDYALLLNALAKMDRDSHIIFSAAFDALSNGHVSYTARGLSALLNATARLQREVPGCAVPQLLSQVRMRTTELSGWQLACVVHGLARSVPNAGKDGEMISGLSRRADEVVQDGDVSHQGYVMLLDGFSRLDCLQTSVVSMYCNKAPDWGLSEQAIVMGIASMARVNYYHQPFLDWSHQQLSMIRRIPPIGLVTALVGYAKLEYRTGIHYVYHRIIDDDVLSSIQSISQCCILAYALLLSGGDRSMLVPSSSYNVLLHIITALLPSPTTTNRTPLLSNASKLQLIAVLESMGGEALQQQQQQEQEGGLTLDHVKCILDLNLFDSNVIIKVPSSSVDLTAGDTEARSSTFQEDVGQTLRRLDRGRRWAVECQVTPYLVDIVEVKLRCNGDVSSRDRT